MKRVKKVMLGLTVGALAMTLVACGGKSEKTENGKEGNSGESTEKLVVWGSNATTQALAENWAAEKGIEVEALLIPWDDYETKLKQQVGDPKTAPDVFLVDRVNIMEWLERDNVIANLEKEFPTEVKTYKENAYEELVNVASDKNNELRGIALEYSVGMMYFNRGIAKEVFGTDDIEKISEEMKDQSKWVELNEKVKKATNGEAKLIANAGNFASATLASRTTPLVVKETFTIDQEIVDIFDLHKELADNDAVFSKIEDDAYFDGWATEKFFIDFLPTWGFNSKIRPNVEVKDNPDSWGLTKPIFPFSRGGSFFLMTEGSKNKELAMEFLNYAAIETESMTENAKDRVNWPSSKKSAEELVATGYEEPILGGQQPFPLYDEQAKIQEKVDFALTKYDLSLFGFIQSEVRDYAAGNTTREEALKRLEEEVQSAYPELKIKKEYK